MTNRRTSEDLQQLVKAWNERMRERNNIGGILTAQKIKGGYQLVRMLSGEVVREWTTQTALGSAIDAMTMLSFALEVLSTESAD